MVDFVELLFCFDKFSKGLHIYGSETERLKFLKISRKRNNKYNKKNTFDRINIINELKWTQFQVKAIA